MAQHRHLAAGSIAAAPSGAAEEQRVELVQWHVQVLEPVLADERGRVAKAADDRPRTARTGQCGAGVTDDVGCGGEPACAC